MLSFYGFYYPYQMFGRPNLSGDGNIWMHDQPTREGIIIYSIITPMITFFGIIGNALSLMVFTRRELKGSIYVYLAVLAGADMATSILVFFSGLFKGTLFKDYWPIMDVVIGIPLLGITNCLSVITTLGVTVDRAFCLKKPLSCHKPTFCNPQIAKKIMIASLFVSIVFNLPYCFIFEWNGEQLITKPFFYSQYYSVHNWICFFLFGVLPSILLIFGNGYLIFVLQKLKKITRKCNENLCSKNKKDYSNLTTILIFIVFFFLVTEIPTLLISRVSAVTFFFANRKSGPRDSDALEAIRQVITILSAFSLTANFFLYLCFCPSFVIVLRKMFTNKPKHITRSIQMNVFVIEDNNLEGFNRKIHTMEAIAAGMIKHQEHEDYPSSLDDVYRKTEVGNHEQIAPNRKTTITLI